jgi:crotonobetainyl-CoA hydratase
MDAAEAARWGLVNEILAPADLLPRARALARQLADGPPLVFAAIKEVIRESETLSFHAAIARIMARGFPTVARLYGSEDQLEGARAFAEKRYPIWKGR